MPSGFNEVMDAIHKEIELGGPADLPPTVEGEQPRDLGFFLQRCRQQMEAVGGAWAWGGERGRLEVRQELVLLAALAVKALCEHEVPPMGDRYDRGLPPRKDESIWAPRTVKLKKY